MQIDLNERDRIFESMMELNKQQTDRLLVQIFAEFEILEKYKLPFTFERFFKIVENNIKN